MMIAEIIGGTLFGSMALVADGCTWRPMSRRWRSPRSPICSLAATPMTSLFARHRQIGELAAFSSAIILGMIALGVAYESLLRLGHPVSIHFREGNPDRGAGALRQSPQRLAVARRAPPRPRARARP